MPSRRTILKALALSPFAAACNSTEPFTPPTFAPPRGEHFLDLTELMSGEPRPLKVDVVAKAAVRIWTQNPANGALILTSGVRISGDSVIGTAAFRKNEKGEVQRQRLNIRLAMNAGNLLVREAVRVAAPETQDTARFEVDRAYPGTYAYELANLSDMQPGMVMHHVGYQDSIAITSPAPQVGFKLAFLYGFAGYFFAAVGPSEGGMEAQTLTSSSLGGPIITPAGDLLGIATNVETVTVGDVLNDRFGTFDAVVSSKGEVPSSMQVVTGRVLDQPLMDLLYSQLVTIPTPGS